jgi:hypothetical protein
MGPLAVLLGAAAAGGTYVVYKEVTKPKPLDPSKLPLVDPKNQPGLVNLLDKGRTYAILVMYDWTKIPGATPTVQDKDATSRYIKTIFGGGPGALKPDGLGFKLLSEPALRGEADAKLFFAGQPSAWVMNGQWLRDERTVSDMTADLSKIFPTAAFYLLPVA